MIPFSKYDYLTFMDIERCPYRMGTWECGDWSRKKDERDLLTALDRYADELQKKETK